jgi:hypothetical protein
VSPRSLWLGISTGAKILYTVPRLTAIAFQTATLFILAVSLGLVLSVPERGMLRLLTEEGSAGILTRRILPAAVGVPLMILGYSELFLLSEEIKRSPQLRRMGGSAQTERIDTIALNS